MKNLNTIYNEDCLEGMKNIPDKSIDMILCDLPYGTTACKWDVIIPFEPLWFQYERVIKDNGAIVLTGSQPFSSLLVGSNIRLFKYEWIWKKGHCSNFAAARYVPMKEHENIMVFGKGKISYSPQMGEKSESSKNRAKYKYKPFVLKTDNPYGGFGFQDKQTKTTRHPQLRFPSSVIKFNRDKSFHPTQKPVALFEYLIKTYTNEGETVLDNCIGSGTTAIACLNTNRNFIGFEKDEKYYQLASERIEKQKSVPQQLNMAV